VSVSDHPAPNEYVDLPAELVATLTQGATLESGLRRSLPPPVIAGPRIGRFEILDRIGSGGFGVVYKAHDPARDRTVAVKTLHRVDPEGVANMKREFRALAAIRHPNLVQLDELGTEDGLWYLTMEWVDGVDFIRFVRPDPDAPPSLPLLRLAIGQLALTLAAAHDAGVLHLDLKPSNVLVTPEGRVVLLDFGLATHLRDADSSTESRTRGTPAFMAPEQVRGAQLSEASDWYGLGGILYAALSGRNPFVGESALMVMAAKLLGPPEPLGALAPGADPELAALAMDLLRQEPAARPHGAEVLRRLHLGSDLTRTGKRLGLVGRESELHRLRRGFEEAKESPTVVVVEGTSGMGKSKLVDAFLQELADRDDAFVLRSRCHERAHVPYRALDGAIDELAERLLLRDREALGALATPEVAEALRMFPALTQVAELEGARTREVLDPAEARRRAFTGLERLVAAAAGERVVVLAIDDLQWSDEDSALLLGELLRHGNAPRVLVVGTARTDLPPGPLRTLFDDLARRAGAVTVHELEVGPLEDASARELAASLFDEADAERDRKLARRSRGVPLVLEELASEERTEAFLSQQGQGEESGEIDVSELLIARLARLPAELRTVVELVSVADRPLPREVIAEALDEDSVDEPLDLVLARLARYHLLRVGAELEPFHGRTRESVLAQIHPASLTKRHRSLASAHARRPRPDHGALAHHHRGAGDLALAGEHAVRAAEDAEAVLAFGQAAEHYQDALRDLPDALGDHRAELMRRRADALANAGRGVEAGEAYLACVEHLPEDAIELRRLAGEGFLTSAAIDRGREVLAALLEERGVTFPATRNKAIAGLVKNLLALRLRGTRFTRVPDEAIAPETREQLELLVSANKGYATFSPVLAGYFALELLRRSLAAGYESGAIYGLDYYALMTVYPGGAKAERRGWALLEEAAALARDASDPVLRARRGMGFGVAATALGRFAEAVEFLEPPTEALGREVGVAWELAVIENTRVQSLVWLGRLHEARERVRVLMRWGEQTGDHYTYLIGTVLDAKLRLAAGSPAEARANVAEMLAGWTTEEFTFQHLFAHKTAIWCDLYGGDVGAAEARFREMLPALKGSGLLSLQLMRAEASVLEGTVALGRLAGGDRSAAGRIRKLARWLGKTGRPYAQGYGAMLRAGLARAEGDESSASRLAELAESFYETAQMAVHVQAMRLFRGEPGADAALRELGIADPECWLRIYLPT